MTLPLTGTNLVSVQEKGKSHGLDYSSTVYRRLRADSLWQELMNDLKDLSLNELYAVLKHVRRHRIQAMIHNDKQAKDNATWLIACVAEELRKR